MWAIRGLGRSNKEGINFSKQLQKTRVGEEVHTNPIGR